MSQSKHDFTDLRVEYAQRELLEQDVALDPHQQFMAWFDQALAAKIHEPYAMTLATVDAKNRPHARIVLLRSANSSGYEFYSNYQSHKGLDLAHHGYAELMFFWPQLEQQIRISGAVEKLSSQESSAYFHKRPKDSQIAAHVSQPQSGVISDRNTLLANFLKLKQQYQQAEKIEKPEAWGGYRLIAEQYEFWQGRPNRMHDRLRYRKDNTAWIIERLMP